MLLLFWKADTGTISLAIDGALPALAGTLAVTVEVAPPRMGAAPSGDFRPRRVRIVGILPALHGRLLVAVHDDERELQILLDMIPTQVP